MVVIRISRVGWRVGQVVGLSPAWPSSCAQLSEMAGIWQHRACGITWVLTLFLHQKVVAHGLNENSLTRNLAHSRRSWRVRGICSSSRFTQHHVSFPGCWMQRSFFVIRSSSSKYELFKLKRRDLLLEVDITGEVVVGSLIRQSIYGGLTVEVQQTCFTTAWCGERQRAANCTDTVAELYDHVQIHTRISYHLRLDRSWRSLKFRQTASLAFVVSVVQANYRYICIV